MQEVHGRIRDEPQRALTFAVQEKQPGKVVIDQTHLVAKLLRIKRPTFRECTAGSHGHDGMPDGPLSGAADLHVMAWNRLMEHQWNQRLSRQEKEPIVVEKD